MACEDKKQAVPLTKESEQLIRRPHVPFIFRIKITTIDTSKDQMRAQQNHCHHGHEGANMKKSSLSDQNIKNNKMNTCDPQADTDDIVLNNGLVPPTVKFVATKTLHQQSVRKREPIDVEFKPGCKICLRPAKPGSNSPTIIDLPAKCGIDVRFAALNNRRTFVPPQKVALRIETPSVPYKHQDEDATTNMDVWLPPNGKGMYVGTPQQEETSPERKKDQCSATPTDHTITPNQAQHAPTTGQITKGALEDVQDCIELILNSPSQTQKKRNVRIGRDLIQAIELEQGNLLQAASETVEMSDISEGSPQWLIEGAQQLNDSPSNHGKLNLLSYDHRQADLEETEVFQLLAKHIKCKLKATCAVLIVMVVKPVKTDEAKATRNANIVEWAQTITEDEILFQGASDEAVILMLQPSNGSYRCSGFGAVRKHTHGEMLSAIEKGIAKAVDIALGKNSR